MQRKTCSLNAAHCRKDLKALHTHVQENYKQRNTHTIADKLFCLQTQILRLGLQACFYITEGASTACWVVLGRAMLFRHRSLILSCSGRAGRGELLTNGPLYSPVLPCFALPEMFLAKHTCIRSRWYDPTPIKGVHSPFSPSNIVWFYCNLGSFLHSFSI